MIDFLSGHSLKLLDDYLKEVITNSSKCQTCIFQRQSDNEKDKNFCFFGFNCIRDDFSFYNNGT